VEEFYSTKHQSCSSSLFSVGSGSHCLRCFILYLTIQKITALELLVYTPQHWWKASACMQSNSSHTDETRHRMQSQKYLSKTQKWSHSVQAFTSKPPDHHWKAFPLWLSKWLVVCVCVHLNFKVYKKRPSVKKCDCYPAHKKQLVHGGKSKALCCSGFWVKKVDTSWAPVWGNKDAYNLRREITWGLAQWKRTCCSSWTSSVSHRWQVGELLWLNVAVSKRRVLHEVWHKLYCEWHNEAGSGTCIWEGCKANEWPESFL